MSTQIKKYTSIFLFFDIHSYNYIYVYIRQIEDRDEQGERRGTKHEFTLKSLFYFITTGFILHNSLCLSVISHPTAKNQRETVGPWCSAAILSMNVLYFQCTRSESLSCTPCLILINNLFISSRIHSLCPFLDSFPLENTCQSHLTLIILLCHTPGHYGFIGATVVV